MIIDVHHHYLPPRYFEEFDRLLPERIDAVRHYGRIAGHDREAGYTTTPAIDPICWCDETLQLEAMDAAEVDHAVLSAACFQDWMTMDAARIINEGTAHLVSRHPDRFSGMISVPPDGGEEMVEEIRRARDLGLCAVNMTTTHRGRYPDHKDFRLMLETAANLKLPVYVHPSWRGPLQHMERWNLERSIGKPTDLNLGIANLMFGGAFAELPDLRMVFAHLGGSLPVTMRRLFFGQPGWLSAPDYDYPTLLKRLFVDTAPGMWQSPLEIQCAAMILGVSQMLMGSDYPLSNDPAGVLKASVDHVRLTNLSDTEKERILATNAIEVFGLHHLDALSNKGGAQQIHPAAGCC
ncbi:amidohydrolase family protein [Sphingopyxis sp. SE2]|uniref:amidohydrolase family protein n=1 Tax=Sphingopyxis sp. SE2 TaxID=1586240 RepID=UPI0028C11E0F|nr:amidohydrolase family protein [Sphingopyxis sp. SE2]MDT7531701.1 amidohydrolase family protein [Sphingopyxis sp. SE2]